MRFGEHVPVELDAELGLDVAHQGAVEGRADIEPHDPFRAGPRRQRLDVRDRLRQARNDRLPGVVVVGDLHDAGAGDVPAQRLDPLGRQPDDRRHRARGTAADLGHELAAAAHQAQHGLRVEHPGGGERRILAEAVPRDAGRLETTGPQHLEHGQAGRGDRGLGHVRAAQLLRRARHAQLRQREAEDVVRHCEDLARGVRVAPDEVGRHAGPLGALPGEHGQTTGTRYALPRRPARGLPRPEGRCL